ncbi:sensor histidine kinase [Halobacillus fulvus]|nr:sensor histidine kinase [Halobacillus fulvus]
MNTSYMDMIRLFMFYLISYIYYISIPERTTLSVLLILLVVLGFTFTHFMLMSSKWDRYVTSLTALDFALITLLSLLDPGSTLYLILFGVSAVTLFMVEYRKKRIVWFSVIFLSIWLFQLGYSYVQIGAFNIFSNMVSLSFVVFCVIVGRLIRQLSEAQETVAEQYDQLNESHAALKDAHDQLKIYSEQVEEWTVMEERNRISREIHDTVGHKMTALLVQLQVAKELRSVDPEKSAATIQVCEDLARNALQEIRMSVRTLQEGPETYLSFIAKTRALLQDYQETTGLVSELHVEGESKNIPPSIQLTIIRIIQEAVTNAVKHGNAKRCEVSVRVTESKVDVRIFDDGSGTPDIEPGFGVLNMKERVQEHGGQLTFHSEHTRGFEIKAVFPLKKITWKVGEPL